MEMLGRRYTRERNKIDKECLVVFLPCCLVGHRLTNRGRAEEGAVYLIYHCCQVKVSESRDFNLCLGKFELIASTVCN